MAQQFDAFTSFVKDYSIRTPTTHRTRAMLSQGLPRDATVNFDSYFLQRHRAVSLSQHAFLVGLCLQTAVNYLSKSDMY